MLKIFNNNEINRRLLIFKNCLKKGVKGFFVYIFIKIYGFWEN